MTMPFNPYQLSPDLMRSLQMQGPAKPSQKMSLWDRIQNAVAPVPQGMDGLLGEQDIKDARNQGLLAAGAQMLAGSGPSATPTNFAQIAGQGLNAGMQGYQGAVQQQIGNRSKALDIQSQRAQMQSFKQKQDQLAQITAARKAVFQQYGPPPSGDPTKMSAWIDQVAPALLQAGDNESVNQLVDYRKALKADSQDQMAQTGDTVTTFTPGKGFWDATANGGKGGYVPQLQRHMGADEIALKKATLAETNSRTAANLTVAQQGQLKSLSDGFQNRYKDIAERAPVIEQALLTLRDSKGVPALYTSSIANFIQAADQKAQIRWQLLQYFKNNVDPSIGGRWETLKARMLQGTLPGYTADAMIAHLEHIKQLTSQEWDRRRAGEMKRHPGLDAWIPPSDELYLQPAGGQQDLSGYHFGGGQ